MINNLWKIRVFVYDYFKETTRPPSTDATAARFDLTNEEAAAAYEGVGSTPCIFS